MYTICKNVCNQVSVTNIVVQVCTDSTHMVIDQKRTGHPHLYGGPAGTWTIFFVISFFVKLRIYDLLISTHLI